jgi:hypothetical protein
MNGFNTFQYKRFDMSILSLFSAPIGETTKHIFSDNNY